MLIIVHQNDLVDKTAAHTVYSKHCFGPKDARSSPGFDNFLNVFTHFHAILFNIAEIPKVGVGRHCAGVLEIISKYNFQK